MTATIESQVAAILAAVIALDTKLSGAITKINALPTSFTATADPTIAAIKTDTAAILTQLTT